MNKELSRLLMKKSRIRNKYTKSSSKQVFRLIRSSHSQMSFKMGVLKNFGKFHRKTHELESLLNKVAGLKAFNFTKTKIPNTSIFTEHLRCLFLAYNKIKN